MTPSAEVRDLILRAYDVLTTGEGNPEEIFEATAMAPAGGSLESFYFGFGADDAYVVADFPDQRQRPRRR